MAAMFRLQGKGASPGTAFGQIYLAVDVEETFLSPTDPSAEHAILSDAVQGSIAALRELAARSSTESASILEFQIEMLLDPEITEMAARRIGTGDGAALAWVTALDNYIAGFEQSDNEAVRARAADLFDIKSRVLAAMTGKPVADFPVGFVFVGKDISPSVFLAHDWSSGGGIVLFQGSAASHVSMLARAKSVPMVIETGTFNIAGEEKLLLDGGTGSVVLHPSDEELRQALSTRLSMRPIANEAEAPCSTKLRTADGAEISLSINVNDLSDIIGIDHAGIEGIGLLRTEFLMSSAADIANEDRQYGIYRQVLEWAGQKPVTIRMLDLGGDKPVPDRDGTSFLGLRGIRLLLARPEFLRIQARALLRSAVHGNLKVMLPMVTLPSELEKTVTIFREELTLLQRRRISHRMPPIGIMVEVPATAIMLDTFGAAEFFSFGTNDLVQYLTAAARDNAAVADIYTHAAPAIFRLLEHTVHIAATLGAPVSVCGDMAGEPEYIPALLRCGLRHFSLAPAQLAVIRSQITQLNADGTMAVEK
ncbi:phosphoenolpyruvate--protein phosphotransferase [Phyllobacterium brassicacearum]|uniref:Phosphoenolpyruvate-protein phosphotransferase n=1 Tax=Phyllobacterium brassicacearum TaxID=314235 RepID=A0A2P7BV97_9HYPH|nr:putative PEP-binding protein [Phyllobacterium brassicacearum]PSH70342.1 phosphoenolpyruvate--protein phosphotransferase [Phyllobacterium brassicacearum]TDQ28075.1 phosphoenolpyruvate--protein phosphotransferase [Phyllobacterium brassicacearum]